MQDQNTGEQEEERKAGGTGKKEDARERTVLQWVGA